MQEQFTVRIYDMQLVKKIKSLQKELEGVYKSKTNPFLVDCIVKGMKAIERERLGVRTPQDLTELFDEVHKTFEKLTELVRLCEMTAKETMANLTVNQKILTNNYNMLLGISDNAPVDTASVEDGVYENLPKRFEEMLESLLTDVLNVVMKKK